jgi:hypothetical protein
VTKHENVLEAVRWAVVILVIAFVILGILRLTLFLSTLS